MSKQWLVIIFLIFFFNMEAFSQADTLKNNKSTTATRTFLYRDSASLARWQHRKDSVQAVKDSIKAAGDSIAMVWIKAPDSKRPNLFVDSLLQVYSIKNLNFVNQNIKFQKKNTRLEGKVRSKGEFWIFPVIVLLLLFFAVLKNAFSKDFLVISQSFYNNRILSQISKEDTLFNSWPFIFLYLLFGFTIGMLLYLCGKYFQVTYLYNGFQWFFILSVLVLGLFTLKILVLRILGFLFDVQKIVREYISILYLSYFNAAIIYLPLVIAFSLSPLRYLPVYIYIAIFLLVAILFFQLIRLGRNILSNHRFSKIYLFIYLCALEICPLLILIKALRF